jgi:hypothetical protein
VSSFRDHPQLSASVPVHPEPVSASSAAARFLSDPRQALPMASPTIRRCTPNFFATPVMVPMLNSYSRRSVQTTPPWLSTPTSFSASGFARFRVPVRSQGWTKTKCRTGPFQSTEIITFDALNLAHSGRGPLPTDDTIFQVQITGSISLEQTDQVAPPQVTWPFGLRRCFGPAKARVEFYGVECPSRSWLDDDSE